ncbi:MAG: hypothetical protein E6Q36_02690 [Chryseobacterium sp.]|nr:MAG: hypothetical protein E6Q36_02690 [Chryseobacterium sp.]
MNIVSTVIGDFLRKINSGKIKIPVPIILVHPKNNFATLTWWGEKGFFRIDAVVSRFNFEFGLINPEIDYSWMESVFFEYSIYVKENEISECIQKCLTEIGHVS